MLRWDEVEQRRISEQHRSSHAFDDDDSGDNESVLSDDGTTVPRALAVCALTLHGSASLWRWDHVELCDDLS